VRVTPAILANELSAFQSLVESAETFTDYVQIDMMDGLFVPSHSISAAELARTRTTLKSEAHLMVKDPENWLEAVANFGSEEVIFHFEAVDDPAATIKLLRDTDFRVGLGVNPGTPIEDFLSLAGSVDTIMFMAVNPGFYGAPFILEVMDKIRVLRQSQPFLNIGVDGGIKLDNAILAKDAGADFVCVGSAIFAADDPAQAYCQFKHILNRRVTDPVVSEDC
jgi:ribulose-phosphate 3-epimerase